MKPRGRKPTPLHGRGPIEADAIYPVAVFMRRLGIGRSTLRSLRRRGLRVHSLGRRCVFVFGAEVIEFLRDENGGRGSGTEPSDGGPAA